MHGTIVQPRPRPSRSVWRATRRMVLVGGGATVGLALGWLGWPRDGAPVYALAEGEHAINAWLKIGTDGIVTVLVPQAEMGQGAHSGLAQILADELGADWRTVAVEPAPIHFAYANKALIDEGTAALPSLVRDVARWVGHRAMERVDAQLTGGSTSVRAYEAPLRHAGAAARAMLCKAAARGWGVDWKACKTADGFVTHGSSRVRFAEVAAAAARETPPAEPVLRPLRPVGRAAPRLDIPAKVDGSARFGADVRLPGMVYAAIRHGPAGGTMPPRVGAVPAGALAVTSGANWVAVTAPTWFGARTALDALEVTFARPAVVADTAVLERAIRAALATAPALKGEGRLVEARYLVPFVAHAALETMTATARVGEDRAELWAPTQSTRLLSYAVARALGFDEAAVTVHATLIGGGFGRKVEVDAGVEAALIARDVGRPVQIIWSREEDMTASPMRPMAGAHLAARLRPDGSIAAWRTRIACPSTARSFAGRNLPGLLPASNGPDAQALEGATAPAYRVGHYEVEHLPVEWPGPLGYWRSVGHSYTAFFTECFVDELARTAGADPLLYRLAHLPPRSAAVLRAAAERAGYVPGMGVAVHDSFGSVVAQVVELAPGAEPRVKRVTVAIDAGRVINPDSVRAQMDGSVVWGLNAALTGRVEYRDGRAQATNFDGYPLLGLAGTPEIEVAILTNPDAPIGGVGEPGVPPLAPALANAIAASTGRRPLDLPLVA